MKDDLIYVKTPVIIKGNIFLHFLMRQLFIENVSMPRRVKIPKAYFLLCYIFCNFRYILTGTLIYISFNLIHFCLIDVA